MSLPAPTSQTVQRLKVNREDRRYEGLLPQELKEFMKLHGFSEREFANFLGVTPQCVSLWLLGKRDFSLTHSRIINLFKKYPELIKEF